ncbi:MAG: hypothetical protein NC310_04715 [Roseburia sp.]|nr:hypothetical protein [Anaeroplasma bactoclasticum]MCM1196362.1 hypothetical protein [Roseburia sp.]MCM1557755.1 hypothetical protein [Anaeroplasma bactoclasticum]
MKLQDALLNETKDKLKDLANTLRQSGISKLKKHDLVDRIEALLKEEGVLHFVLNLLDEKCHSLLKRALREKIFITEGNLDQLMMLRRYGIVYQDAAYMIVPEDLAISIRKIITKEFYVNHKKFQWLFRCMLFAGDFYGIFTIQDLMDLLKLNKKVRYTSDVSASIDELIHFVPLFYKQDNEYISMSACSYGIEELRLEQEGKKRFIPTVEQIDFYYENGYLTNQYYQVLINELKKRIDDDYIIVLITKTFFSKVLLGETTENAITYLISELEPEDEMEAFFLASVAIQTYNNTNMITNKGKTPIQTRKEQNK